ncbi:alpha/beta hydrolase [Marinobacter alexandrii]|uniref:alpha/beta hydrolase n=1 Tax=Marinobacter alexandrii TaxID=2570351 RepID=UPI001109A1B3|nr:alpha/beta hydrolase [Marinobacter alexandrii]
MSSLNPRPSRRNPQLSLRSRWRLWLLRWLLRPLLAMVLRGGPRRLASAQLKVAARGAHRLDSISCGYDYFGEDGTVVPGHFIGRPFDESGEPVLLWLHGGAFVLPAMPEGHLAFAGRVCESLSGSAFLPDYRLAPAHPFPAGLDDCEAAYRLLLDAGISARRIILGGESAGGNLVAALLQRLARKGLPMPGCAIAVSPALDLSRLHGTPSRSLHAGRDAMLPATSLTHALEGYLNGGDASDPEVSPLLGDLSGLPPTFIVASEVEFLRDDSVHFARRLTQAGVPNELMLWTDLPHAFPLLEDWFPEARQAREDIAAFIHEQLGEERNTDSNVGSNAREKYS